MPLVETWPASPHSAVREPASRTDGRRNRDRLLDAAGALLASGEPFSLADVAGAAGLSTATAYRHFSSAEDVAIAFGAGFFDDLDDRAGDDAPTLDVLCRLWVEAVLDWGPALSHLRSRRGLLARRALDDARVGRLTRLVEPALAEGAPRRLTPGELSYAVAAWNALADPREVLDQHETLGWSADRIATRLSRSVRAVISTF